MVFRLTPWSRTEVVAAFALPLLSGKVYGTKETPLPLLVPFSFVLLSSSSSSVAPLISCCEDIEELRDKAAPSNRTSLSGLTEKSLLAVPSIPVVVGCLPSLPTSTALDDSSPCLLGLLEGVESIVQEVSRLHENHDEPLLPPLLIREVDIVAGAAVGSKDLPADELSGVVVVKEEREEEVDTREADAGAFEDEL